MASLLGFGAYLPKRVLHNDELAKRLGCTPEWIYEASGIRERRIADAVESVVDLAVSAAKDCLAAANLQPAELGMVIVSSGSSERRFPGPAVSVALQLGIAGVPCLDLPIASAGIVVRFIAGKPFGCPGRTNFGDRGREDVCSSA